MQNRTPRTTWTAHVFVARDRRDGASNPVFFSSAFPRLPWIFRTALKSLEAFCALPWMFSLRSWSWQRCRTLGRWVFGFLSLSCSCRHEDLCSWNASSQARSEGISGLRSFCVCPPHPLHHVVALDSDACLSLRLEVFCLSPLFSCFLCISLLFYIIILLLLSYYSYIILEYEWV